MGDSFRIQRVRNLIREEIGQMIVKGSVKDPRISRLVSISDVDVSRDIKYAKIYVSGFEGAKSLSQSVEALNHASGFIQMKLAKKMKTRNTPVLTFLADTSIEHGFEMINKIEDLNT